jgi:predicted Rossmann fold nucleotide-binding protein DprA/Smf involved in DNA uptake
VPLSHPPDGPRLYDAITEALSSGALTIEEVARRVECSPHEVLEVLVQYDRASRISLVPGDATATLHRSAG